MYWYLQYLSKTRSRHLERIRGFIIRNHASPRTQILDAVLEEVSYAKAMSFVNFSTLEAAAIYGFADALSCLYVVLDRLLLLPTLPRPYSNDVMRYEVRMKPFLAIGELISSYIPCWGRAIHSMLCFLFEHCSRYFLAQVTDFTQYNRPTRAHSVR